MRGPGVADVAADSLAIFLVEVGGAATTGANGAVAAQVCLQALVAYAFDGALEFLRGVGKLRRRHDREGSLDIPGLRRVG